MNANPSVNRYLDDKAFDHIDHALGRPIFPERESYRNRFATEADSAQAREFDASPLWQKYAQYGGMAYYAVTDAGRRALADHLTETGAKWRAFLVTYDGHSSIVPAKTAAKAKYVSWLEISDCLADLTFGDFARVCSVKVAA